MRNELPCSLPGTLLEWIVPDGTIYQLIWSFYQFGIAFLTYLHDRIGIVKMWKIFSHIWIELFLFSNASLGVEVGRVGTHRPSLSNLPVIDPIIVEFCIKIIWPFFSLSTFTGSLSFQVGVQLMSFASYD